MNNASLLSRLIALAIDFVLLNVIIFGLLNWVLGLEGTIAFIVTFLVGVVYHTYFYTQNNGQTPGKSIMGIRVVNMNGEPLSVVDGFLRYLGYHIDSLLLFLGWLWAIPDPNNRALHDYLAGTRVVDA